MREATVGLALLVVAICGRGVICESAQGCDLVIPPSTVMQSGVASTAVISSHAVQSGVVIGQTAAPVLVTPLAAPVCHGQVLATQAVTGVTLGAFSNHAFVTQQGVAQQAPRVVRQRSVVRQRVRSSGQAVSLLRAY